MCTVSVHRGSCTLRNQFHVQSARTRNQCTLRNQFPLQSARIRNHHIRQRLCMISSVSRVAHTTDSHQQPIVCTTDPYTHKWLTPVRFHGLGLPSLPLFSDNRPSPLLFLFGDFCLDGAPCISALWRLRSSTRANGPPAAQKGNFG